MHYDALTGTKSKAHTAKFENVCITKSHSLDHDVRHSRLTIAAVACVARDYYIMLLTRIAQGWAAY